MTTGDREDVSPPEGGYQYSAHLLAEGTEVEVEITADVARLYDLVVSSMDWGSGFLDAEEMIAVAKLGRLCGFEVPRCQATISSRGGSSIGSEYSSGHCGLDVGHEGSHQGDVNHSPIVNQRPYQSFDGVVHYSPMFGENFTTKEEWDD